MENIEEEETKQELADLTRQTHTKKEVIQHSQKLCGYVLQTCGLNAEDVIKAHKLNFENPVHLMTLCGTLMSDVILRDMKKMAQELAELKGEPFPPSNPPPPPSPS